jgi:multidrug efflux pump subunit AcrB
MLERIAENPGLINVDSDLKLNKPQLDVIVNRDKVADAGIQVDAVSRTLESLLGGRQVTRFKRNGEQYDVYVQLGESDRSTPRDLSQIYVRGGDGGMIQLSNLVEAREVVAPKELNRFNQLQDEGRSKLDAVIEAAVLHLRPILMTTGAMVLGALLTLFVVPTTYTLLTRTRHLIHEDDDEVVGAHPAPAE